MPRVSVILPSLNVGRYIKETLESVCNQTLKDIEIICVDAGSIDGTLEIIEEYCNRDSRVQLVHSERKSYGYQMNLGIEKAVGEYIGIVETDDHIDSKMYESLYLTAKENNLDIIKSNYRFFFEGSDGERLFICSDLSRENGFEYNAIFSSKDYISGKYINEIYIWDGIYRTSFLREKNVKFNESPGASFQDFGFRYLTNLQVERMMIINDAFYNYRKDNLEASTYNTRTVNFILEEVCYVREKLFDKLHNNEEMYQLLVREAVEAFRSSYRELIRWRDPDDNVRNAINGFVELIRSFIEDNVFTIETIGMYNWKLMQLMIQDPELFMNSTRIMLKAEADNATDFIKNCSKANQIVIFGSGAYGKAALTFLRACGEGEKVVAFADNNPNVVGKEMYGVKVIAPEDAAYNNKNSLYVIASPSNSVAMRKQLRGLGIEDSDVVVYNYSSSIFTCASGINIYKAEKEQK